MVVAPAVVEGVSGAAGGIAALLTTYPLMTISTLQATRSKQVWPSTQVDRGKPGWCRYHSFCWTLNTPSAPIRSCSQHASLLRGAGWLQGKGQADEESFVVPVQRRKGTFADIAEVISTSGYQGLYRGLQPALVGTAVSQGALRALTNSTSVPF